jgi:hypothetical protein
MNLLPAEGPGHCPSRKCRCHQLNDLLEIYNKLRAFEFSVHTGFKAQDVGFQRQVREVAVQLSVEDRIEYTD